MSHRDIAGCSRARRYRQPDDPCAHGPWLIGQDTQSEAPGIADFSNELRESVRVGHERVVLGDGIGRRRVLHRQGPEAEVGEELVAVFTRRPRYLNASTSKETGTS